MTYKTRQILEHIAKQHGVTTQQVERDMLEAIRAAMRSADPQAQRLWARISPSGELPSIDEFLKFCAAWANTQAHS